MGTPLLNLYAPADGADPGLWGGLWNSQGSGYLDSYFAAISTIAITGATYTLSAAEARSQMLRITGTLLQSCVISAGGGTYWNGFRSFENLTTGAFTVTFSNGGGSVVIPQGRRGVVYIDSTYGPRITSIVGVTGPDDLPVGTRMMFQQAAAPTGWAQDTTINDTTLRITGSTGGATGGSVAFSTLFARTAVDGYTLQITDIPAHTHTYGNNLVVQGGGGFSLGAGGGVNVISPTTTSTGGGGSHTHNIDMRVKYADAIIAVRQ